jgi:hypothetical protein
MSKPKKKKRLWKNSKSGKLYAPGDPQFIGHGNPPGMPNTPGAGLERLEMVESESKPEPQGKNPYTRSDIEYKAPKIAAPVATTD